MLKTVVLLNIFVDSEIYVFSGFFLLIECLKEQHLLFETEIFYNIINVFVTFNQFDTSWLN